VSFVVKKKGEDCWMSDCVKGEAMVENIVDV
jgi:hypothetical protein